MAANPQVLEYLRRAAIARDINPDVAVRAFGHEALNVFDPNKPDYGGDHGSSFGPTQLHYGGISSVEPNPGLGDAFTKATGLDARDPSTWPQQIDFALDHVVKNGWGAWMGAAAEGITGYMGVGNKALPRGTSQATASVSGLGGPIVAQREAPVGTNPYVDVNLDLDNSDDLFDSPLADALASSVKGQRDNAGTGMLKSKPKEGLPTLDYASAVPAEAPTAGQEPSLSAPALSIPQSQLADLFQVADIGGADRRNAPLPTVDYGRVYPRRRREV